MTVPGSQELLIEMTNTQGNVYHTQPADNLNNYYNHHCTYRWIGNQFWDFCSTVIANLERINIGDTSKGLDDGSITLEC